MHKLLIMNKIMDDVFNNDFTLANKFLAGLTIRLEDIQEKEPIVPEDKVED